MWIDCLALVICVGHLSLHDNIQCIASASSSISSPGDLIIAGFFPIHSNVVKDRTFLKNRPSAKVCVTFEPQALRWALTMVFAIEEINKNNLLIPNITLGYLIHDSCFQIVKIAEQSLNFLENTIYSGSESFEFHTPRVVVGPLTTELSRFLTGLLELFSVPLISYGSTCDCLSDKRQYPFFLRTVPNDVYQAAAMAHLMDTFHWIYVGTLAVDDDYCRNLLALFVSEAETLSVYIAYQSLLQQNYQKDTLQSVAETLKRERPKVAILFVHGKDFIPLAELFLANNLSEKAWVGSATWISSPYMRNTRYAQLYDGTIGIERGSGLIPGLKGFLEGLRSQSFCTKKHLDRRRGKNETFLEHEKERSINLNDHSLKGFLNEFWKSHCNCCWVMNDYSEKDCPCQKSLDEAEMQFTDVSRPKLTYTVYLAVLTVAHALDDLHTCIPSKGPFENGSCSTINNFKTWQLLFYLQKVMFTTSMATLFYFDENGDLPVNLEILNWQLNEDNHMDVHVVGYFKSSRSQSKEFFIDNNAIIWKGQQKEVPRSVCSDTCPMGTRKFPQRGEPVCCFDCITCTPGEYSNETDSEDCYKCPQNMWSNEQNNGCVRINREFLSFFDPVAIALIAFAMLGVVITVIILLVFIMYRDLSVVRMSNPSLMALLLVALSGCLGSSVLFIGEPTTMVCQLREPIVVSWLTISTVCLLSRIVQIIIENQVITLHKSIPLSFLKPKAMVVLLAFPQIAFCIAWSVIWKSHPTHDSEVRFGTIVVECSGEYATWSSCALAYLALIVTLCFYLTLKANKLNLPFNETRLIGYGMIFALLVFLASVPAYISTKGKFAEAIKIFAVIAIVYGFEGCTFASKSYCFFFKRQMFMKVFSENR